MTPPQITWLHHGTPVVANCVSASGMCYLCGGVLTRGAPVARWMGSNFTDQNRARNPSGTHVCEACCYIASRVSPVLGREAKEGKKFGGCFRNYSHCADERGYLNASKGEKPAIRSFLERDHEGVWFAAIADSGQKHVLPFTTLNGPGRCGVVLFEEMPVEVPDSLKLVEAMATLLTAGATKDEIERGDYRPATWLRCEAMARAFEAAHGGERASPWFSLALWLAQRDEEAVEARQSAEKEEKRARQQGKRQARNADGGGAARAPRGVSADRKRQRAEALGDPAKPSQVRGEDQREPRGVGDEAPARPSDPSTRQLGLFGGR